MKRLLFALLLLVPLLTFADKKGKGGMRKEKELVGVVTGALCGIKHQVCSHSRGERYELLGILDRKKGFFYIANVPQDILQKFFGEEIKVEGKVHRERATIIADRILKGDNVVWEGGEKTNPK
ncbi:hypothetical protein LM594_06445 [Candidatus Caldipriscus sp.]|nr:hypothetical protein [Candidatus Caldipriscus sp.]